MSNEGNSKQSLSSTLAPTAAKNDQAKADLSLIPQIFLTEVAKAFMVGEAKYGRYNYTKGHKSSQLIAAAMRHLTAYNDGEELDPTDGQPHLGSVGACIAMLLRQQELGTLNDNRFSKVIPYKDPALSRSYCNCPQGPLKLQLPFNVCGHCGGVCK